MEVGIPRDPSQRSIGSVSNELFEVSLESYKLSASFAASLVAASVAGQLNLILIFDYFLNK